APGAHAPTSKSKTSDAAAEIRRASVGTGEPPSRPGRGAANVTAAYAAVSLRGRRFLRTPPNVGSLSALLVRQLVAVRILNLNRTEVRCVLVPALRRQRSAALVAAGGDDAARAAATPGAGDALRWGLALAEVASLLDRSTA